jgi:hypothetical protein
MSAGFDILEKIRREAERAVMVRAPQRSVRPGSRARAGRRQRTTEPGFRELEEMRFRTEQRYIIEHFIPRPRSWLEDLFYRTKHMTRAEVLSSEPLWGKARDLCVERRDLSFTSAYKLLADKALHNKGRAVSDAELVDVLMQALRHKVIEGIIEECSVLDARPRPKPPHAPRP